MFVGSYPLGSGTDDGGIPFLRELAALDAVDGVELPWRGSDETRRLIDAALRARPDWRIVVTMIPWTMQVMHRDPAWGIASTDEICRRRAVREHERALGVASELVAHGTPALVHVHSAPRGGSANALRASLAEFSSEQGDLGARLVIEHVDALVAGHAPAKGFLDLADEIETVVETASVGLGLNWARSAIELRDGDAVVDHVAAVRATGRLRTLVFSGVSAEPSAYGDAWADAHVPPHSFVGHGVSSLLTPQRIARALEAAHGATEVGVKIAHAVPGRRPDRDETWAVLEASIGLVASLVVAARTPVEEAS